MEEIKIKKFFKDFSTDERKSIFTKLNLIPNGYDGPLNHAIERNIINKSVESGLISKVEDLWV